MGFTLFSLFTAGLLLANALAVFHEQRFLRPNGWSWKESSGFATADEAGPMKKQVVGLLQAVQYMRVPLLVLNVLTIAVKLVIG